MLLAPTTRSVLWAVLCWVAQLCLTLCNPMDCSPPGSSVHADSPGKNTGVGCHALLQRTFPTQGANPGLPRCRRILYCLSYQVFGRCLVTSGLGGERATVEDHCSGVDHSAHILEDWPPDQLCHLHEFPSFFCSFSTILLLFSPPSIVCDHMITYKTPKRTYRTQVCLTDWKGHWVFSNLWKFFLVLTSFVSVGCPPRFTGIEYTVSLLSFFRKTIINFDLTRKLVSSHGASSVWATSETIKLYSL